MSKRIFPIFLFGLIFMAIFSFGHNQPALAEEPSPVYQFTPVSMDSLYASADGGHGCPEFNVDTALYRFELRVTGQVLTDLEAALADGGRLLVGVRTASRVMTEGEGEATANTQVKLIVEHADDNRTSLASSAKALDQDTGAIIWQTLTSVGQLEVGDTLVVEGLAQGTANSVGCDSGDQALISWELTGVALFGR